MTTLWAGVLLFVVASILATLLQVRYRWSYDTHPLRFICLFLTLLGITAYWFSFVPNTEIIISLLLVATLYIGTLSFMRKYWYPIQKLYGAHTVPKAYSGIIKPKLAGDFVKVTELLLQDIAAWLIVAGLYITTPSTSLVVLIFTFIVWLLHLPAPKLFGVVYGRYFLWLSTVLAFIVPLLYPWGMWGFVTLYATHILAYIIMYLVFGWLGYRCK